MVEDQGMSVQDAAAIMQDARARARKELVISAPVVYAAWGLVWLIGYGAMWLSVRGQHPYRAPAGVSIAAVFVLAAFAAAPRLAGPGPQVVVRDAAESAYRAHGRALAMTYSLGLRGPLL